MKEIKTVRRTIITIAFTLIILNVAQSQGYLHRNGSKIVNGSGDEVILRGIGLGGWMLQEPYMLNMSGFVTTQHGIKSKIQGLIGVQNTDTFYTAWLTNHMRKIDVDSLAAFGFNSIRLPMHYNLFTLPVQDEPVPGQNTWLTEGFELVDSLLAWCTENHVYLILDLHAAPGGQGHDSAICDYDARYPSLWENVNNRSKTVSLWKKLAERYKNEEWIGGYDLINETNWTLPSNNLLLRNLYVEITDSIRDVDTNHILFIEGNWFANDFTGLTPAWDNNMAYSFHKYGTYNNQSTIQWILNIRNTYNIPIWCGEAGENSNTWYTDAIILLESNKIGWSWWSWKKFSSITGITSVIQTNEYKTVLNYWNNGGTKPSVSYAKSALMGMTENIKLENCVLNRSVVDAMFRQVTTIATIPYTNLTAPGIIHATDYDLGRNSYAYFDTDTANYQYSAGTYTGWNNGYEYRNDGVDIQTNNDVLNSNGYNVGWTAPREWMNYTINIDSTAGYNMVIRYAGTNSVTKMRFLLDDVDITPVVNISATGAWTTWDSLTIADIILTKGTHVLKVETVLGGCNLSYYSFENPKLVKEIPFNALTASTSEDSKVIHLTLNKDIEAPLGTVEGYFAVNINNNSYAVESADINGISNKIIDLNLQTNIHYGDAVTLDYTGTTITSIDTTVLDEFTGLSVINNLPVRYNIPGKIQAENYYYQTGMQSETTTDAGGGMNMGYIDAGDYADYLVHISDSAYYNVTFRVAALSTTGSAQLQLIDEGNNKTTLSTYSLPATGGWQAWQSKTGVETLPAGYYTLRVYITTGGFNLNWIQFDIATDLVSISDKINRIVIYPNPCSTNFDILFNNYSVIENALIEISDISGKLIYKTGFTTADKLYTVDVSTFNEGIYIVNIITENKSYISKLVISR